MYGTNIILIALIVDLINSLFLNNNRILLFITLILLVLLWAIKFVTHEKMQLVDILISIQLILSCCNQLFFYSRIIGNVVFILSIFVIIFLFKRR